MVGKRLSMAVSLLWPAMLSAQEQPLTLEAVVARARTDAQAVAVARARIEEAKARRLGAELRFQSNPELDVAMGPRSGPGDLDIDLGVMQRFEPSQRRSARIASADATITRLNAEADEVAQVVIREAARAFVNVLYQEARGKLLEGALDVAREVSQTAERRYRAGDVAILDVNVARTAVARAQGDVAHVRATRETALGELRALIGWSPDVSTVAGVVADYRRPRELPGLLAQLDTLPELDRLRAEQQEAAADLRLAQTFKRADFGLGARYEREDAANIVLGGLTVSLPAFNKGQEAQAVAEARRRRADLELTLSRQTIELRVRSQHAAYQARLDALEAYERDALSGLDESELLARRSYEAGELSLAEWLLLRRELLDTRMAYVDHLFEAAAAGIEVDVVAGVLR